MKSSWLDENKKTAMFQWEYHNKIMNINYKYFFLKNCLIKQSTLCFFVALIPGISNGLVDVIKFKTFGKFLAHHNLI